MKPDKLFSSIDELQGSAPWESVLDAGSGPHSIEWILGLPTTRWTAVTADPNSAARLRERFGSRMRPGDRVISGDWSDILLLHGEVYDVVVADYLLGALDGFAPFFQDRLFPRLRPHVGSRLYVVGLAPYPAESDHPWGQIILQIVRLRDACILLAGHRTYREYPLDWTLRHLEIAEFEVQETRVFPILYGPTFVNQQLDVARSKLGYVQDRRLRAQLESSIRSLRERALALHDLHRGTPFGEDYLVYARPRS